MAAGAMALALVVDAGWRDAASRPGTQGSLYVGRQGRRGRRDRHDADPGGATIPRTQGPHGPLASRPTPQNGLCQNSGRPST